MNLIANYNTPCVKLIRKSVADNEGGFSTMWEDGAEFCAAIVLASSNEAVKAERKIESSAYSVIVSKEINLEYHDVFKRVVDGKVFRVTSSGAERKTPASSALDMRKVTAEEWRLT